ncbi:giant-lens [Asbolus verrucosus]|uniref:Giant-lens n=1 Tax=Asbolus verrucosus TaxID=1661398 RepID=A0A482VGN4_ASBVE|nr:giant-lens [Asbolus verrucosus]
MRKSEPLVGAGGECQHCARRLPGPRLSNWSIFPRLVKTRRKVYDCGAPPKNTCTTSDADLPECGPRAICNKLDMYDAPWIEKQCRCSGGRTCPLELQTDDGYTVADKTRQYKLCEPVKKIPKCRFFRDTTWTITLYTNNVTEQIVHCHCPKNSMTYLTKRQALHISNGQVAFQYYFSCSPQARLRCQRKEPCRLFTVRKRQEFLDEVNVNSLCQCPHAHRCPHHHMDYGVIAGKSYTEEAIKTYSGYCLPS